MSSPSSTPSRFLIVCLVGLIGSNAIVYLMSRWPPPKVEEPRPNTEVKPNQPGKIELPASIDAFAESTIEKLLKVSWERGAAAAVVKMNHRYLFLIHETSTEHYERIVNLLGRLGDRPVVQKRLREWPELAGLLMRSLEQDSEGPELILKTFSDQDDLNPVRSLYGLASTPDDSIRLARILGRDGDLVVRLWKQGVIDAADWFDPLPEDADAQTEYRRWLRSVFETALKAADEATREVAIYRAQMLLTIHSRSLRELLDKDDTFRREFLSKHWPLFRRILDAKAESDDWIGCVLEPRVWILLGRFGQSGADKFDKYGAVAIDLLLCPEYQACTEKVFDAFDHGDEHTLDALFDDELRRNGLFVELLNRDLPGGKLAKALHELKTRPTEQPALLRQWKGLSLQGLTEELGPPPEGVVTWLPGYSSYYLGRKLAQGRDVSGLDVAGAAVDAATTVFMVGKAVNGLKVVGQGLAKAFQKGGMNAAAKWAAKATAKELYPWVIRDAQIAASQPASLYRTVTQVDVTDAVRFAFEKSGRKLSSFKQVTNLDARIFMRADRRIVFAPAKLLENRIAGPLLAETATGAGFEFAVKAGDPVVRTTARTVAEQELAWRQHLSLWWLSSNDGSLESPAKK